MIVAAVLTGASLAAWAWLLLARGFFWRADQRFHDAPAASAPAPSRWPPVVAVVPARNEAEVIDAALASLLAQDYPGDFRVVAVDDGSTDGTSARAQGAARGPGDAARLAVVTAGPRPEGWTGKAWAMAEGLDHARRWHAGASYVQFTDADIVHAPAVLRGLVAKAEAEGLALTSLMVRLDCAGGWGRLLIPAFVFFFQKLYPFRWVNDPGRRTAAAAGGCMLVRCAALDAAGGLAAIRGALIDDCALARALKPHGPIWLALTESSRSIRPYGGLVGVWRMVARSAFDQLRYSPWRLAGTILGMALLYLVPPLATLAGAGLNAPSLWVPGAAAWGAMAIAYAPTLKLYGLAPLRGFALCVAGALYGAMTVDSALRHWRGQGGAWKGRTHAGGPGRGMGRAA